MDDDFNTPIVIANLFELTRLINLVNDGKESLMQEDIDLAKNIFSTFLFDILGLVDEPEKDDSKLIDYLMDTILTIRSEAKAKKDYATSDKIRDELAKLNIEIKDTKDGAKWNFLK
jgi:cysteinyl-tRNA synthetase